MAMNWSKLIVWVLVLAVSLWLLAPLQPLHAGQPVTWGSLGIVLTVLLLLRSALRMGSVRQRS